jgi:hypothetical protein
MPGLAILAVLAVAAASVPPRYRTGTIIGLLIVGGLDGLPGPDLTTVRIGHGLTAQDLDVIVLCAVLFAYNLRHGCFTTLIRTAPGRAIVLSSLAFAAWWLLTLYRTTTQTVVPLVYAANYGHDLLSLVLMFPLLIGPLRNRDLRPAAITVVASFATLQGLLYLAETVTGTPISVLVHVQHTAQLNGLTRVYAPIIDLFVACLPLGLAAAFLGPSRRIREAGGCVAAVTLLAIIAGQTRAQYVASLAGILAAGVIWSVGHQAREQALRRRLRRVGAVTALVIAVVVVVPGGHASKIFSSAASRLASITSTASSSNTAQSTVAVRLQDVRILDQQLQGHSAIGLGFLDPSFVWNAQLAAGGIRNPDVGVFNVIATTGIVGTVLYYIPLVGMTFWSLLGRFERFEERRWLTAGVFAWCVTVLITSVTLVTLFSTTGVVSAATVMGLAAAMLLDGAERPPTAPLAL